MNSNFDVQFWNIRKRAGRRKPWEVRWRVGTRSFSRSFLTRAMGDTYRSNLVGAARKGQEFSAVTGEPLAWGRGQASFYSLARESARSRWVKGSANTRKAVADGLSLCVLAMLDPRKAKRNRPDDKLLRNALKYWAFVPPRWGEEPEDVAAALAWIENACLPVAALEDGETLARVLERLSVRLDGKPYAKTSVKRYRSALYNACSLGVTRKLLASNPLDGLPRQRITYNHAVDPRIVPTLGQARDLLAAVAKREPRGKHLHAFFSIMYYAGCRPSEVIGLRVADVTLPLSGWGLLTLSGGVPDVGQDGAIYTDSGRQHDAGALKHRAAGAIRPVPIPPGLVAVLRDHIAEFPPAKDGRLFYLEDGSPITGQIYRRVWRAARKSALTKQEAASKLAWRPYDLRHGCASLLLGLGVAPAEVARRLGHSMQMLFTVYAHWLSDMPDHANTLIEKALKEDKKPQVTDIAGHGPHAGHTPEHPAA